MHCITWLIHRLKMEDVVETSDDDSIQSENEVDMAEEKEDEEENGNPKLADALAKVVRMAKSKNGKSVVLSKAKLYSPKTVTKKKAHGFEIEPNPNGQVDAEENEENVKPIVEDIKPDKKELKSLKITKQEKFQRGRVKPSVLDRNKERALAKIATKGVVKLFNVVRQQQSIINKQINQPGVTEGKKEKILKSIDKKAFLEVLSGKGKTGNNLNLTNGTSSDKDEADDIKSELKEEPSWQVLRDDFMMGAKLKDWDKKEVVEVEKD